MKRVIAILLTVILVISLAACAKSGSDTATNSENPAVPNQKTELVIFAAASMTETLEQIAELYKQSNPDITLTFNFDSSGTLKTQIEEGAVCELFISAAQKQMNSLQDGG